jgi:hypothetical protein
VSRELRVGRAARVGRRVRTVCNRSCGMWSDMWFTKCGESQPCGRRSTKEARMDRETNRWNRIRLSSLFAKPKHQGHSSHSHHTTTHVPSPARCTNDQPIHSDVNPISGRPQSTTRRQPPDVTERNDSRTYNQIAPQTLLPCGFVARRRREDGRSSSSSSNRSRSRPRSHPRCRCRCRWRWLRPLIARSSRLIQRSKKWLKVGHSLR